MLQANDWAVKTYQSLGITARNEKMGRMAWMGTRHFAYRFSVATGEKFGRHAVSLESIYKR